MRVRVGVRARVRVSGEGQDAGQAQGQAQAQGFEDEVCVPVWAAGMMPAERNCAPLNLRMKLTSLYGK